MDAGVLVRYDTLIQYPGWVWSGYPMVSFSVLGVPPRSPLTGDAQIILGGAGGDDGQLLRHREGFPGEMAQAAPDFGARQGS